VSAFDWIVQLVYVAAASCFVLGLHLMNTPATARRGNQLSTGGMVAAIVATLAIIIHAGTISVTGWIVMLARTRAIDRLRARNARPDQTHGAEPGPAAPLTAPGRDPEQVAVSEEDGRKVRQALTSLPPEQRTLVEMAYYEGLTQSEIAERTGLPKATVSRLTQTLVITGMLERDDRLRVYRLAPAVLSLAHATTSQV